MAKDVFIIKADGKIEKSVSYAAPKLDVLQAAVGGNIETLPNFTQFEHEGHKYTRGTAYCNEDGISKGLPFNKAATDAWLKCLKGPLRYEPHLLGDVIFYASAKK